MESNPNGANGVPSYCPPYTPDRFCGFPSDLQIICPCAHLLNLTDKIGHFHQFTEKALHWRANILGGNEDSK